MAEVGVLAGLILLAQTIIAAFFAARNKYLSTRSKRLSRLEPAHLDLLDWGHQVLQVAKARGYKGIPQLPPSVQNLYGVEEEELVEMPLEQYMEKLQAVRRDPTDKPPA